METINKISNIEEFSKGTFSDEELASSPIRNYFKGRIILLTGGMGFIGQLLLEKLLCCDVRHIYLIARAKKGKSANERLCEMFSEVQFKKMKKFNPNYLQQVSIIEGDMSALELGIKSADRELLQNTVQIIIHCAANVRFNERLYDLILANLRGTRELLRLAEKCKKFEVFNYVSTAYSNCAQHKSFIKEDFYDASMDPDAAIAFAERCANKPQPNDLENLEILTERLIGNWPNTYSFSKSLSEQIILSYTGKFPICVTRPSIVISTYQQPLPGWCNNVFGLNGMLIGGGIGILRISYANQHVAVSIVCADFTINAILAATWATYGEAQIAKQNPDTIGIPNDKVKHARRPKVYAIVATKNLSYDYIHNTLDVLIKKDPMNKNIWKSCRNTTTSIILFKYLSLYYHFIATLLLDLGLLIIGENIRLMPSTRKIHIFSKALSYFMLHEWEFENVNTCALYDRLHPVDRNLFFFDTRQFDFEQWGYTYMQGLKVYLAKEKLEEVAQGRIKMKRLNIAHYFALGVFYLSQTALIYLLAKGFGLIDYVSVAVPAYIEFIKNPNGVEL